LLRDWRELKLLSGKDSVVVDIGEIRFWRLWEEDLS
jgi:hypothetical protein